jgi:uncharacterized membrane protein
MEYILILILCVLATTKAMIQSRFAKGMIRGAADAILFNGLIFVTATLTSSASLLGGVDGTTLVAGCINGLACVCFQLAYIEAFRAGPVSITVLIVNSSMLVQILFSWLFYNEEMSVTRIIGIVLICGVLYFAADIVKGDRVRLRWILLSAVAFLMNNVLSLTTKIYTNSFSSTNQSAFVTVSYLSAAVFSVLILVFFQARGENCIGKMNRKFIGTAAAAGVVLGLFQLTYTYSNRVVEGTLLFPMYNGGSTLLITLASTLIFREKLSKRQIFSLTLGIIAIVLMSV